MSEEISIDKIREAAAPVLDRHDVVRAELFGSFARSEQDSSSDVDIVVELKGKKTLIDLAELKKDLENAIGREVDLMTYDAMNSSVVDSIHGESVEI